MRRGQRGFTLVELLVVIGIIAVLTGLLMPAIASARRSAKQTQSMSNLRQMMIGYTMYHQENKGWVLFGYTWTNVSGTPVRVDVASGHQFGVPIADRYPWRLLPYCSDIWDILHSHTESVPPSPSKGDTFKMAWDKAYNLSLNPTYGLNGIFIGGHKDYFGFGPGPDYRPLAGKHVVFKANEVRAPTSLIVFAECMGENMDAFGGMKGQGFHTLSPPVAMLPNWEVAANGELKVVKPEAMGVPRGWNTKRIVTSFFDGHVDSLLPGDMTDMRMWANWATKADYDFANE